MNQRSAAFDEGFIDGVNSARVCRIDITKIMPNPAQPRKDMDQQKLQNLAENIKRHGIIQPVTVRPRGESYLIIAGERRWRAAQLAGLRAIPVIIRSEDDDSAPSIDETALIENMQREDLNLIDELEAINNLRDRGRSVEEITVITGRSATHIKRAKRVHAFFMHLMAGGFADYNALAGISSRYGLSVIEKAARIAEETDDLEKGLSLLQSGVTAGELGEKVQIELAYVEEKRDGDDGAPAPSAYPERTPREPVSSPAPDPSTYETGQAMGPAREPDDDFLDEISFSSEGKKTEEPPENDTKYTQNGEIVPGEDLHTGDPVYDRIEKKGYDRQENAPDRPGAPPVNPPVADERKIISGKILLKKLGILKRAMEDLEPVSDMQFKVRKNDRELLANLARDIELLLPVAARVISAIETCLGSAK